MSSTQHHTEAVTGRKATLRHHAFWHKAHDETHGAVHATQAGPDFASWQAKLENLHVVVH